MLQQNDGAKGGGIKAAQELNLTHFGTVGHFNDTGGLVDSRTGFGWIDAP